MASVKLQRQRHKALFYTFFALFVTFC